MSKPDDQMFFVKWETTVRHSLAMTRGEIRAALGHEPEELAHHPIIDADLYPGEPGMDGSRYRLAEALGELESDDPERDGTTLDGVDCRVIRWVEEA